MVAQALKPEWPPSDAARGSPDNVNTTWKRMKKGAAFVIMPKTVLLNESIKGQVPTPLRDLLVGRVFGVHKTMDEFKGRPGS